jgi:hypothetical protein
MSDAPALEAAVLAAGAVIDARRFAVPALEVAGAAGVGCGARAVCASGGAITHWTPAAFSVTQARSAAPRSANGPTSTR